MVPSCSAPAAFKKIASKCVICRRLHGSIGKQQMADLPQDRVFPDDHSSVDLVLIILDHSGWIEEEA